MLLGRWTRVALCFAVSRSSSRTCCGFFSVSALSMTQQQSTAPSQLNVLGGALQPCSTSPMTGFLRDGFCKCPGSDSGIHSVCSVLTEDFLQYTKSQGNDLSTPQPAFGFPGLKAGDRWCLCAGRWFQAENAGAAPGVILESTHERTLEIVPLEKLAHHAVSPSSRLK